MLRHLPVIAMIVTTSLSAADVSGRWAGTIEMNTGRIPFYLALNLNDGKINGFASTGLAARQIRIENSELRDDGLSFEIYDDAARLVHFRLTLTSGVLAGEGTVGTEVWRVAVVPVGGGFGDRNPSGVSAGFAAGVPTGVGTGTGSGAEATVGGGVFRVGGGVSAPLLIHKVEPEYTEEARLAKYQGTVLLYVEIGPDGTATNIKVARSLGLGLNEKAIECVKQWRFKPGMKDGRPVTVMATIEVNFRL
jgi:TonB family protein